MKQQKLVSLFILMIAFVGLFSFAKIAQAAPTIKLLTPNGGEALKLGDTYRITWESTNIERVNIGYSYGTGSLNWMNNGATFILPNIGYYDWKIGASGKMKVRISGFQTGFGYVNDESDDFFNVTAPVTPPTPPVVTPPKEIDPDSVQEVMTITVPDKTSYKNGELMEVKWTKPYRYFDEYMIGWSNTYFPGNLSADVLRGKLNLSKDETSQKMFPSCTFVDLLYARAQQVGMPVTKDDIAKNFVIGMEAQMKMPTGFRIIGTGKSRPFSIDCSVPTTIVSASPTTPMITPQAGMRKVDPILSGECLDISVDLKNRDTDATKAQQISILQNFLNKKGFLTQPPTGLFGQFTVQAVKKFQKANNISSTGVVGPMTRSKIKNISCGVPAVTTGVPAQRPNVSVDFTRSLEIGAAGADVTALQEFLGRGVFFTTAYTQGIFDEATKAALTRYQQSKGITPATGVFGPVTRAAVAMDIAAGK